MNLVLKATQECDLAVTITDARGNAATVQNPTWESSEPETISVTADPANPLKAVVKAVGPVDDESLVTFKADADLGEGVAPIIATLAVVVVAGQATVVEIAAGEVREQA